MASFNEHGGSMTAYENREDVKPPSPIQNGINEAHKYLGQLDENIDRLATKLTPVLNNSETPSEDSVPKQPAEGSEVYLQLSSLVDKLGRLNGRINTINYRLEV